MMTGIRAGFLVCAALAVSLMGCGKSEPQKLSDEESKQKAEEMKRQYQEKMGGTRPGMKPEDMRKAMEGKFKPGDKPAEKP